MNDPVKSISTIRNFMGNAGRNTCNDYLYEALQDAVEALEKEIPKPLKERHYEEPGEKPYIKYCCPNGCKIYPMVDSNFCRICGQRLKREEKS